MKIKKERTARRLMAFLAAVCMFGSMPELSIISRAETGIEDSLEESAADVNGSEQDMEEGLEEGTYFANDSTQKEEKDQKESGDGLDSNKEEAEEKEPGDSGTTGTDQTENPDKSGAEEGNSGEAGKEDTGEPETEGGDSKEPGSEKEGTEGQNPEDKEPKDPDSEQNPDEAEDADLEETGEPEQTEEPEKTGEEVGEMEEEEQEEIEEEEITLLSVQAEDEAVDNVYTDANGIIYHYDISEDGTVNIYDLESYWIEYGDCKPLEIPAYIDGYAVTQLTFELESKATKFPSVTIPETVTYMNASMFERRWIGELHYNAEEATTGAKYGGGVFSWATIKELYIGENVRRIPDYLFDSAYITRDELTLNVEYIGVQAFSYNKNITTVTIGESVKEIGARAFEDNTIASINYNAANATLKGSEGLASGVFSSVAVSAITIGETVTAIPSSLFSEIEYTADTIDFPECLTSIGSYAFYGSKVNLGELTISETMTSIGQEAFSGCKIGKLNYNAVDAQLDGVSNLNCHRTSFFETGVGELQIGECVKRLPNCLFYSLRLTQDTLVIPDSVTDIGEYVLSRSNGYNVDKTSIGTLEIGENVTHIGRAAFGNLTYGKVIVRAVETDNPPPTFLEGDLPVCSTIEIHGGSDYYEFFTAKTDAENITLFCEDFETAYGETYYDAEKGSFVTPVTETCTVCGYEKSREEYGQAYTVIFADYDGRELSRQNVRAGEDAKVPDDPERTGYRFTGWDKSYTNITSDLTVTAEYEIRKFSVVFKDGDRVISEQEIGYEGSAAVPEDPTRPDEEWGSWKFTGWSGNYTNVKKDEIIRAQFERIVNEYEVIFYDAEDNILSRQKVAHGEAAQEPEAPDREPSAQYHYFFTGWSGKTGNITTDMAFYPVYDTTMRTYTVTFMDEDIVLETQTVEYGSDAKTPENPTRPAEEWGSWKFIGWDGSYTMVVKDEIVQAQFEKSYNEYEVLFYDAEGNVLSRQKVTHGEAAQVPEAPEKKSTARYDYIFTGWSEETENITGNTAFYPRYETKTRTYKVTFMNGDAVYVVQDVAYGLSASAPADPVKKEDAVYTYRFIGWDRDFSLITGDLTVHAVFEQIIKPKTEEPDSEQPKEDDPKKEEPKGDNPEKQPEDGDGGDEKQPDEKKDNDNSGQPDGDPIKNVVPESPACNDSGEDHSGSEPKAVNETDKLVQSTTEQMEGDLVSAIEDPETDRESVVEEVDTWVEDGTDLEAEQEPEMEAQGDACKYRSLFIWLLLLAVIGAGVLGIWLFLFYLRKRTVCGTILEEDGSAVCGAEIVLTGRERMETKTDEDGRFCFSGLKKDSYRLRIDYEDGQVMLSADIHMESSDEEEVFLIIDSSCSSVETKRERGTYQVDLIV